jgi:two-component system, chemotaxis family, chemotaxis protein CheY
MREVTVLIVDDSSVMRKIIQRSLREAGIAISVILEAGSGTEALEILSKDKVDLICSDVNMPKMDGLQLLREIRTRNLAPDVPIVMITTESSSQQVMEAVKAGAQQYIRKPFTSEQVRERITPLLTATSDSFSA